MTQNGQDFEKKNEDALVCFYIFMEISNCLFFLVGRSSLLLKGTVMNIQDIDNKWQSPAQKTFPGSEAGLA